MLDELEGVELMSVFFLVEGRNKYFAEQTNSGSFGSKDLLWHGGIFSTKMACCVDSQEDHNHCSEVPKYKDESAISNN